MGCIGAQWAFAAIWANECVWRSLAWHGPLGVRLCVWASQLVALELRALEAHNARDLVTHLRALEAPEAPELRASLAPRAEFPQLEARSCSQAVCSGAAE